MKLTVKCFATLMPLTLRAAAWSFTVRMSVTCCGSSVSRSQKPRIIFVNGIGVEKDALLHDGDRVGDFPPRGRRVISVFAQYVEIACRAKRVSAVFWIGGKLQ